MPRGEINAEAALNMNMQWGINMKANFGDMHQPKEELVFDNELKEEVEFNQKTMTNGVIGIKTDGSPIFGIFTIVWDKNVLVCINGDVYFAIDKFCANPPYELVYNNRIGYYEISKEAKKLAELYRIARGKGGYPYKITKYYNAEFQLKNFNINRKKYTIKNRFPGILKYTVGIEFEASAGYLPQEECFKLGLVPLRDGSITSVEYATIVMDESKLGLLKEQINKLAYYTEFDKECSLHMHFGGFPVESKSIMALYKVCKALEPFLIYSLPKYTFKTSMYKRTGKDYCNLLPECSTFNDLYAWASDYNARYAGSLTQSHPCDPEKQQKWNIKSRYFWLNLVNMLFYNSCKTVEFRMLRPTYNFNKIIYWLYVFNAILIYAEAYARRFKTIEQLEADHLGALTLRDIFMGVYPEELAHRMYETYDIDLYITKNQTMVKDFIGKHTDFEDVMYKDNILE